MHTWKVTYLIYHRIWCGALKFILWGKYGLDYFVFFFFPKVYNSTWSIHKTFKIRYKKKREMVIRAKINISDDDKQMRQMLKAVLPSRCKQADGTVFFFLSIQCMSVLCSLFLVISLLCLSLNVPRHNLAIIGAIPYIYNHNIHSCCFDLISCSV